MSLRFSGLHFHTQSGSISSGRHLITTTCFGKFNYFLKCKCRHWRRWTAVPATPGNSDVLHDAFALGIGGCDGQAAQFLTIAVQRRIFCLG